MDYKNQSRVWVYVCPRIPSQDTCLCLPHLPRPCTVNKMLHVKQNACFLFWMEDTNIPLYILLQFPVHICTWYILFICNTCSYSIKSGNFCILYVRGFCCALNLCSADTRHFCWAMFARCSGAKLPCSANTHRSCCAARPISVHSTSFHATAQQQIRSPWKTKHIISMHFSCKRRSSTLVQRF